MDAISDPPFDGTCQAFVLWTSEGLEAQATFCRYQNFRDFVTLTFDLLLKKKLTLSIAFEPKEIRLSYFTCVFLVARPFCRYQNVWLRDLDLDFWPSFEKKLTLAITFKPKEIGLSYFTCVFLVARPCCWKQFFLPRDLDLDFWIKKINLDHNVWT